MKRAIFNQKGGVGKTSICCNLAAAFAVQGKKTLVVDLDSQANSSRYLLGSQYESITHTIADFYNSTLSINPFKSSLKDCLYRTEHKNLFVIPAEKSLSDLQPKLESRYKIFKLQQTITTLLEENKFDEILFDTPPSLNFYSMSALMAVDTVLVPFDCDSFSAEALHHVQDIVDEIASDHNERLKTEGIVVNHFMANAKLPQNAIDELSKLGFKILKPYLSSSIVMRESHAANRPLVYLKPNHKLTKEFIKLAKELSKVEEECLQIQFSHKSEKIAEI